MGITEERRQPDSQGFQTTVTIRVRVAVPKGQEAEANSVDAKLEVTRAPITCEFVRAD